MRFILNNKFVSDRSVDRVHCSEILAGAFISLYKCAMIKELIFAQLYNRFG